MAVALALVVVPATALGGSSHTQAVADDPSTAPASLPVVKRSLTVDRVGGADRTSYRAPMSGFVSVRLRAARGDWDLRVADAATGRWNTSRSFGSRELVQTWVRSGQRLRITGLREAGSARRARVSIHLLDAVPPVATTPALVRVKGPDQRMLDTLDAVGFDVTHNVRTHYADVIVPDADRIGLLDRLQIPYEVRERDLGAAFARNRQADAAYAAAVQSSPLPTGRTSYRLPADYQNELKAIVEKYSAIARPVRIGTSYQGRPIEGVEIAENVAAKDDGRPVYFVVALHHAREWPSGEMAMEFAWDLVQRYGSDAEITDLLRRERVVIVPIINPDGFFASRMTASDGMYPSPADSTGAPYGDTAEGVAVPFGGNLAYRRKNCNGPVPHFEGERQQPCYYQWGVDPNRNYGTGWGGKGAGSDPNTQSYRGDGQWSEPETQAVHEFSQENPVSTIVSIHNVAALVLRPPGKGTDGKAPDELQMRDVGNAMADATDYQSQYSFQLYDTSGTTEDWNYSAAGSYGYTIEVGPKSGKFHMPYQTGVVREWVGPGWENGGMREALLVGARAAADPATHSVLDGEGKPGAVLKLRKEFETLSSPVCTYSQGVLASSPPGTDCVAPGPVRRYADHLEYTTVVPADGTFSWHVTQSTRPFVGWKYVDGAPSDSTQTVKGPATATAPAETVHQFEILKENGTANLDLRLAFLAKAENYDLRLEYFHPRKNAWEGAGIGYLVDGVLQWTAPGSGSNYPGLDEHVVLAQPRPGQYRATVIRRSGVTNDWTLTIATKGTKDGVAQPTGEKEAWTLTCERGGETIAERQVVVDRGQRLDLGNACKRPRKSSTQR